MEKIAMYKELIMEQAMDKMAKEKRSDLKRDTDTSTRIWRDRVAPELVRGIKASPRAIGGGIAGGILGAAVSKSNPRVATAVAGAGAVAGSYTKRRELEKKDLNRLSNRYFGKDATKKQHDTVRNKTMASSLASASPVPSIAQAGNFMALAKTPESVIQRARREKQSK